MNQDDLKAAQSPCQPETTPHYYTLQEAASHLNVRVADLEHAIQDHRLPCIHQFGRRLIAEGDVAAYRLLHPAGTSSAK